MTWLTVMEYLLTSDLGYVPLVVCTSRSFPHAWLITWFVTRLTQRVSLLEQELLILPEHLSSPAVFSGLSVTRSLVLCLFCISLFAPLYIFFWQLCFLFFFFFFDIRILITSLVSSNSLSNKGTLCFNALFWW